MSNKSVLVEPTPSSSERSKLLFMATRTEQIDITQSLARAEGQRQPSPAEWLEDRDREARQATNEPFAVVAEAIHPTAPT